MSMKIDLWKLIKHLLKFSWMIALSVVIGFGAMAGYSSVTAKDTYTASATLYVYNNNPNRTNYAYTNSSDLSTALQLVDTYMVVIKSNKVMNAVVDRLSAQYPGISTKKISNTLSMGSVSETGVMRISCTTGDPQMSADICNGVVDFAPPEIIRVVGAGSIEVIDYAEVPKVPNPKKTMQNGVLGGLTAGVLVAGFLVLQFLFNARVRDAEELTERYTLPLLSEVPRQAGPDRNRADNLIGPNTPLYILESYNKLRTNLNYVLLNNHKVIVVSSAVPGEGKSTIAANLALTYARAGKRVLMIDGDMRRSSQGSIFSMLSKEERKRPGLANIIIGENKFKESVIREVSANLDLLLMGEQPPNPAELLGSEEMQHMLKKAGKNYDLIVIDTPPINVVSDPLVLAGDSVGLLYVVRQQYSDHREIQKALVAAEKSGVDMLGMVLCGENVGLADQKKGKYKEYYNDYGLNGKQDAAVEKRKNQAKWVLRSESKRQMPNPDR